MFNSDVREAALDGLPPTFECTWASARGAEWATLSGELDIANTPALERALRAAEDRAELVVVDLRDLVFIDCGGMRVIYEASERLRQAGHRMIVVRGPRTVDTVFSITETAERIEIVDLEATEPALQALEKLSAGTVEAGGLPARRAAH